MISLLRIYGGYAGHARLEAIYQSALSGDVVHSN
jgi:hypothetical protein